MATRNFWIEAHIDGRKTVLKGGPPGKDGGFDLDIYMRCKGVPTRVLAITAIAKQDGELSLVAYDTESCEEFRQWVSER